MEGNIRQTVFVLLTARGHLMEFLIAVIVLWHIGAMAYAYQVAESKGHKNPIAWLFGGMVFGPIALLALGFLPAQEPES